MSIQLSKWLLGTLACAALPLYAADPSFIPDDLVQSKAAVGQQGFARIRFEHDDDQSRGNWNRATDIHAQGFDRPLQLQPYGEQVRFRGEVGYRNGGSSFSVPIYYQEATDQNMGTATYSGFGLQWKNRINRSNYLTVAAKFGGSEYQLQPFLATDNTQASIVWSGQWQGQYKPRLTGGLVIGDDRARFEQSNYLARRYYGLVVGGEVTLFDKHTPYVSVSVLRNEYDSEVTGQSYGRAQDFTRFSAGWNWQVSPKWKLRADTHYILDNKDSVLFNGERSRIMFSTEFSLR